MSVSGASCAEPVERGAPLSGKRWTRTRAVGPGTHDRGRFVRSVTESPYSRGRRATETSYTETRIYIQTELFVLVILVVYL